MEDQKSMAVLNEGTEDIFFRPHSLAAVLTLWIMAQAYRQNFWKGENPGVDDDIYIRLLQAVREADTPVLKQFTKKFR